jgi:RNA polymerase sigma-70 factor (ECF subfamily)
VPKAARVPKDERNEPLDFGALYREYEAEIRARLWSMLRSREAVEEVSQETFLRAWKGLSTLRHPSATRAWLRRIATNCALNHLRAIRSRPKVPLVFAAATEDEEDDFVPAWMIDPRSLSPAEQLTRSEDARALSRALESLPAQKRRVVHLVHDQGLSIREAARAMGIPEGTVKSRLHYALRLVEGRLKRMEES